MANEPACPQAPGSETTGHRWGFDKSRSLWTSRRLGVVFGEAAGAGIPASPIPQQAYPIVMCRIVGSQHREQARRCTISSLLPRCSRSADLDPLIRQRGDAHSLSPWGLWERWRNRAAGDVLQSFTIVTPVPNELC